jgi:crossover junction endodeoxyribonuclease RuvC
VAGGVIAAFDPGLKGSPCFLLPNGRVETFPMPILKAGKGHILDEHALARMIDARSRDIEFALIEQQWARPTDGGPQAFKTGLGYGQLRMLLASNFIPYRIVSPLAWRRYHGLTGDKDAARALASQLLPKDADQWALKKHDGRAEAALLALYGVSHPVRAEAA